MRLLRVVELERPVKVDISPALDFTPLGTKQDILEVQLNIIHDVRHAELTLVNCLK